MEDEVLKGFEELVRQRRSEGLIAATVKAVNQDELTIDCTDGQDNEYLDVRLNATTGQTGFIAVPQLGASVIIFELGMKGQEYLMIHAGEVEKIIFNAGDQTEVLIDQGQVRLHLASLTDGIIPRARPRRLRFALAKGPTTTMSCPSGRNIGTGPIGGCMLAAVLAPMW